MLGILVFLATQNQFVYLSHIPSVTLSTLRIIPALEGCSSAYVALLLSGIHIKSANTSPPSRPSRVTLYASVTLSHMRYNSQGYYHDGRPQEYCLLMFQTNGLSLLPEMSRFVSHDRMDLRHGSMYPMTSHPHLTPHDSILTSPCTILICCGAVLTDY